MIMLTALDPRQKCEPCGYVHCEYSVEVCCLGGALICM
jgi:hypothetical protein